MTKYGIRSYDEEIYGVQGNNWDRLAKLWQVDFLVSIFWRSVNDSKTSIIYKFAIK